MLVFSKLLLHLQESLLLHGQVDTGVFSNFVPFFEVLLAAIVVGCRFV
jgi:hypothetical protein